MTIYFALYEEDKKRPNEFHLNDLNEDQFHLEELAEMIVSDNQDNVGEFTIQTNIWLKRNEQDEWNHYVVYLEYEPSYRAVLK